MPILDPRHLIEQAERLVLPPQKGPPRQVDLRRSMSAAYYALFHAVTTAVADQYVGKAHRGSDRYALAYRSIDHARLKKAAIELSRKLNDFAPFAAAIVNLQELRHSADYDPGLRFKTADALAAARTARLGLDRFHGMSVTSRERFLDLLVFAPRR